MAYKLSINIQNKLIEIHYRKYICIQSLSIVKYVYLTNTLHCL